MALQSMTGFGRGEASNENFTLTTEIKSVNHRFRDVRFKMSSLFSPIELDLKKALQKRFKRGSFEVSLNYKRSEQNSKYDDIDQGKVTDFLKRMKELSSGMDVEMTFRPTDFLRSEFLKDQDNEEQNELHRLASESFMGALDQLEKSRVSEGEGLLETIREHRQLYAENFQKIENQAETFQKHVEEKLRQRFKDFSSEVEVDESRFLQEVVFYLEKMDVHEEMGRIHGHLEKLDQLLAAEREVGRQLDFLVQELNRETNTIGSKSSLKDISDCVVQMKVQLEKIREQGLNLE